jgi:leucyl aminopeptidase (aminopeptidase T)
VLVADGAFNANIITRLNARLADNPVRVEIKDGAAVDLTCADRALEEMFTLCLDSPHGRNVGEFGLGTNDGIDEFIPVNSHINERRCGVHLGFGQHNQSLTRVPYVADVHLDLITAGARIYLDDETEPIDLSQVTPSTVPHPVDALDEDITGDCCGMGYGQLQSLACPVQPGATVRTGR